MSDSPDLRPVLLPIPELFHDYLTQKPIEKCLICERNLLNSDMVYMIEKAVKGADVIYEFAVCLPCMEEKQKMISKASAASIKAHFDERVDMEARPRKYIEETDVIDPKNWLEECLLTGKARHESVEHTLYGLFYEDQIILAEFPYMISGPALLEVAELLSPETKDELGRFADENLGVPPEFEELFRTRTPMLI